MAELKRISHVSIFLLFIYVAKSLLAIAVRTSMTTCFGAGIETDAYFAAFTIPQTLSDFFIGGILFIVIIPVFQKRMAEVGQDEASRDLSSLLNVSLLLLTLIAGLYCVLVPLIMPFIFSGFEGHKLELTIRFSMIFSPSIILMGMSLIYTSIYHSFREFFVPSIAALVFPVSSLLSIWCLPDSWGIERLVYGNLTGSLIGLVIMLVFIFKRVKWCWNWKLSNPIIKSAFILSWPVLLESVFSRIVPVIHKSIASGLPEKNAVTLIELSLFVIGSIVGFISGPVSTAVYPLMGQQSIENDEKTVFQTFFKSLNVIFFLTVPFNVLLLTDSREIVGVLFEYGKFTVNDGELTSKILMILSFVILPNCFLSLSGRIFFIFHDTKMVSYCMILTVCLFIPIYYIGAKVLGIYGLVTAAALGAILGNIVSGIVLKLKHKDISFTGPLIYLLKIVACGILMAFTIIMARMIFSTPWMHPAYKLLIDSSLGFVSYIIYCKLLMVGEMRYVIERMPALKFKRR